MPASGHRRPSRPVLSPLLSTATARTPTLPGGSLESPWPAVVVTCDQAVTLPASPRQSPAATYGPGMDLARVVTPASSPTTGKAAPAGLVIAPARLATWADVVTNGRRWSLSTDLRRPGDGLDLVLVDPPGTGAPRPAVIPRLDAPRLASGAHV